MIQTLIRHNQINQTSLAEQSHRLEQLFAIMADYEEAISMRHNLITVGKKHLNLFASENVKKLHVGKRAI